MAVSTAMGQTGQRTLHPFFVGGHGRPDVPPSGCDAPPPQPKEQTLAIEPTIHNQSSGSSDVLGHVQHGEDSNTNARPPPKTRGNRKKAVPDSDSVPEGDSNSSRRKRRRTTPPQVAASTSQDSAAVSYSTPIPLAEQLQNAAQPIQSKSQGPSSDLNSQKASGPPLQKRLTKREPVMETEDGARKTLKLNPNGKLLSSPSSTEMVENVDGEELSKEKRRRSTRKNVQTSRSRMAILRYGSGAVSRKTIGDLIDDMLNGRQRFGQAKQPAPAPAPVSVPTLPVPVAPKATHPFFLGRPAPKPTVPEEFQASNSTESTAVISNDAKLPVINSGNTLSSHTSSPAPKGSNVSNSFRRHSKFPDPIEPIWPPRDVVHIRGNESNEHSDRSSPPSEPHEQKKAKGSKLCVPRSENILSIESQLLHLSDLSKPNCDPRKAILRRPQRKRYDGKTILELAMKELSWHRAAAHSDKKEGRGQHGAVSHLLSSIPSFTTSFDKGAFDDLPWAHKYAPTVAADVLQTGPEAIVLRNWLQSLVISGVDTGGPPKSQSNLKPGGSKNSKKRKKRQKRDQELDGFIVSSGDEEGQMDEITDPDEDELAGGVTVPSRRTVVRSGNMDGDTTPGDRQTRVNAVLISGPSGCGKTAAVHAVAKELGFEIFEINPGSRRSARDVVERVGDMTQNHLVQLLKQIDETGSVNLPTASEVSATKADTGMQKTMNSFFKQNASSLDRGRKKEGSSGLREHHEGSSKFPTSQKQSLILLEEVDILFDEDKSFWNGVLALLNQSKRPIIMTCNDEDLLPLDELSFHAILRFNPPPCDLAVDYVLLLCASEGHILNRDAVTNLYSVLKRDLRATIMQLDFWCQMAVGSKKCGLDWIASGPKYKDGSNSQRTVSCGTYTKGMDWYSQDIVRGENDRLKRETQLLEDRLEQWNVGIMDWQESKMRKLPILSTKGNLGPLDALGYTSAEADLQSSMDLIAAGIRNSTHTTRDALDTTMPSMTGKQRSNYTEAYQFLPADFRTDYADLSANIGSTLSTLLDSLLRESHEDSDDDIANQILECNVPHKPVAIGQSEFQKAFEAIKENQDIFIHSPGRQSPSFENGITAISQDLAPYVRAIVAYDLRLEQSRLVHSNLISHDGNKRMRTTRASRAALEGGDKANTRRERWFTSKLNPARVLATGGLGWQDLLVRQEEEDPEEEHLSDGRRVASEEIYSDGVVNMEY